MEYGIDSFQDYMEDLCVTHTEIKHTKDGSGWRSFARFQSDEEVQQLVNMAGPNIVLVTRYYGASTGSPDEAALRTYVSLRFACKAESFTTEAINAALDKAWLILWDFVARWRRDVRTEDCHALSGIELGALAWDEIPDQPLLEAHYGWELTIPFKSYQPAYRAEKWSA